MMTMMSWWHPIDHLGVTTDELVELEIAVSAGSENPPPESAKITISIKGREIDLEAMIIWSMH